MASEYYTSSDNSYEAREWRRQQREMIRNRQQARVTPVHSPVTSKAPAAPAAAPARRLYTCRVCGQQGYAHEYPFSTIAGGNVCDDCL